VKKLPLSLCLILALAACAPQKAVKKGPPAKVLSEAQRDKVHDYYVQGLYAEAEGKTSKAIELWKKALAIDPQHADTLKELEKARQKQRAVKKLKK